MSKLKTGFQFGVLPKMVMKDPELSLQAKGIYAYLCAYAGNDGQAFPSRDLITYELGITKSTFYKYMKQLTDRGYIEIQKQKSANNQFQNNLYVLNSEPCPKIPDTEKPYTDISDTTINSSTKNNKTINKNYTSFATLKDGSVFLDLYGRFFKAYMEKDHIRIANENISDLDEMLEEVECWDEDMIRENLHDYFTSLPNGNNGNVLSFAKAYHRYR